MKTIYLCRHAKSSWKYHVHDLHRPLNARGLRQAPLVARTQSIKPDQIITSPAVRAYATALAYCHELDWPVTDLQIDEGLYEASGNALVALIKGVSDRHQSFMLFGHNPGLNDLISYLVADNVIDNIVTSGRVSISLNIPSWSEIEAGIGVVTSVVTPADLEGVVGCA